MTSQLRIGTHCVVLMTLLLSACAPATPHYDSRFGVAVRDAMAAQVVDPGAARNANPVAGADGRAARAAQERYDNAQRNPGTVPASSLVGVK